MRQKKRERLVAEYRDRRWEIKQVICNPKSTQQERWIAQQQLQELPRDSSSIRLRNRCGLTGRPRGVYSRYGLGRNVLRLLVMEGQLPGVHKSSW
jgi:small subunit ribosomal protein S14